jgi:hypothetical protein
LSVHDVPVELVNVILMSLGATVDADADPFLNVVVKLSAGSWTFIAWLKPGVTVAASKPDGGCSCRHVLAQTE